MAGVPPDVASVTSGNTGLHAAVAGDHREAVKLLLVAGADIRLKNKYGLTAGDLAVKYGRDGILGMYRLGTPRYTRWSNIGRDTKTDTILEEPQKLTQRRRSVF